MLEFHKIGEGLEEVLLVTDDVSPLVTPTRLAELHKRGMLARPPLEIKGVGTLLIPAKGGTAGGLKHYLLDLGMTEDWRA